MTTINDFAFPHIEDEDIDWVCGPDHLDLDSFDKPRRDFLKSDKTLDVEACPGSGKTTLLVAKLAILVKKWTYRTRGICVLSHTNVAREEIEKRLGRTAVGQRLFAYPHFIGTIHGFVNQFLAIPWVRSNGFPIVAIDDEICTNVRRKKLFNFNRLFHAIRIKEEALRKKGENVDLVRKWRIGDRSFLGVDKKGKAIFKDQNGPSAKELSQLLKAVFHEGYHRHDEMFIWAEALIEDYPIVTEVLRQRFPIVLIDEMQDTTERQAQILNRLFPRTDERIAVQRVGDSNQAIFNFVGSEEKAVTDPFPDLEKSQYMHLPNSYRFGQQIAGLADPFAVVPQKLQGNGPQKWAEHDVAGRHAIFLFTKEEVESVLKAYGSYLLKIFSDDILKEGRFTAVGAVHKVITKCKDKHYPKTVCHYWDGYDPDLKLDPNPQTFVEYIRIAQTKASACKEAYMAVEKIAEAFIRLVNLICESTLKRKVRKHRALIERLKDRDVEQHSTYLDLIVGWAVRHEEISVSSWNQKRDNVGNIAHALCDGICDLSLARDFLAWPGDKRSNHNISLTATGKAKGSNIFEYDQNGRKVSIHLGSIHSIKGQTHTAILLLETFYKAHVFKKLQRWLVGDKRGGNNEGSENLQHLRLNYVAMTRPTHLLCLAMREGAIGSGQTFNKNIVRLRARGWRVGRVNGPNIEWLDKHISQLKLFSCHNRALKNGRQDPMGIG